MAIGSVLACAFSTIGIANAASGPSIAVSRTSSSEVKVVGANFVRRTSVSVTYSFGTYVKYASYMTNRYGGFSGTTTIPSGFVGNLAVKASGKRGLSATASLVIGTPSTTTTSSSTSSTSSSTTGAPTTTTTVVSGSPITFRPTVIPLSAPEIPNPGRGMYSWIGVTPEPAGWPVSDVYWRDQLNWKNDLERSPGVYDFSKVDAGLAEAAARGGRFGFRIMPLCPGCGDNLTPSWVPRQASGVPDWNNEGYLKAWENLNAALGRHLANDPRFGFIDVSGYGACGEWYMPDDEPVRITSENAQRLIRATMNNYPNAFKIMNVNNAEEWVSYAYSFGNSVGSRTDCFGLPGDLLTWRYAAPSSFDRWKVAPTMVEWCGVDDGTNEFANGLSQVQTHHVSLLSSGNYAVKYANMTAEQKQQFEMTNKLAGYRYRVDSLTMPATLQNGSAFTVASTWENAGVIHSYDTWRPEIHLQRADGTSVWSAPLNVDLKLLDQGTKAYSGSLTVSGVANGSYQAVVKVVDPKGYFAPMRLAQEGRKSDGSYLLGTVNVGG